MTKLMYRNRDKKILYILMSIYIIKHLHTVVHSMLTNYTNKCNYMEYINKIERGLKPLCKGTPGAFLLKGVSKCEKVLFMSFQTWLYFTPTLNQLLSPSVSRLFQLIPLGYIFAKGGI